jgi:hypothetical protein
MSRKITKPQKPWKESETLRPPEGYYTSRRLFMGSFAGMATLFIVFPIAMLFAPYVGFGLVAIVPVFVAMFGIHFVSYFVLVTWPCPRCGKAIHVAGMVRNLREKRCLNCYARIE